MDEHNSQEIKSPDKCRYYEPIMKIGDNEYDKIEKSKHKTLQQ